MATRMQQRRGTATQWSTANPILAAGEIGFESDTSKFKIGDGVNHWADLVYYASAEEVAALIDGAPDLLNTLNELAAAIGDDPSFITTVASNLSAHTSDTTSVHGIANTALLATLTNVDDKIVTAKSELTGDLETYADNAVNTHKIDTTDVHGIANTAELATQTDVSSAVSDHNTDTTNVHGITDTADLVTTSILSDAISNSVVDQSLLAGVGIDWNAVDERFDIDSTVATKTYVDSADSAHATDTTNVHGIADTSILTTTTGAQTLSNKTLSSPIIQVGSITVLASLGTFSDEQGTFAYEVPGTTIYKIYRDDTTGVNAFSLGDTVRLSSPSTPELTAISWTIYEIGLIDNYRNGMIVSNPNVGDALFLGVSDITVEKISGSSVTVSSTEIGYLDGVTSNIQTQLDAKAIAANLTNVDNTSDADKPVSTATQAELNLKANLAGATFTGDVTVETNLTVDGNLVVSGTTTTVSAQDLVVSDPLIYIGEGNTANLVDLGLVSNFNDGTYQHSGIVRDSSAGKWKIFKGVTDEPTTTVNFAQGSLDDLAVNNVEVAGVVFSDGTQSQEGVPSRTPIIQKTASYTLSALTERDSLIEMSSSSGVTLTIPTDATLNFPIGTSIDILQTSTGQVTIAAATPATTTVNATPGLKLRTTWSSATLFKRAANTWVVYGDLTA